MTGGLLRISGMEWWNGTLEWNGFVSPCINSRISGMDYQQEYQGGTKDACSFPLP